MKPLFFRRLVSGAAQCFPGSKRPVSLALLGGLSAAGLFWISTSVAQSAGDSQESEERARQKIVSRDMLLNPDKYEQWLEDSWTQEERAEMEISRLAILHPAEYQAAADQLKDAAVLQEEAVSRFQILHPDIYEAEREKSKTAETKALEEAAAAAFLSPENQ